MRIRLLLSLLALLAPVGLAAADIVVHRDPGCGCCEKWVQQLRQQMGRKVQMIDDTARASFQQKNAVPKDLSSCHTALVDGYVIEGHVPIADIKRLVAHRPKDVAGIAVAGMPDGSPGMEVAGMRGQPFDVVAFGPGGRKVFARHNHG